MAGPAPARQFPLNVMHAIRGRVTVSNTAAYATAGVQIGTLPAGAFVKAVSVHVVTAFNAATTNTLDVGTAAAGSAFAATAATLPGAAGFKPNLTGTGMGDTLTADTPIVVRMTQTGTAATAGDAIVLVEYYPQQS